MIKFIEDLKPLIGTEVTAVGTCGIAKDKQLTGILCYDDYEFYLDTQRWGKASINKNTIESARKEINKQ